MEGTEKRQHKLPRQSFRNHSRSHNKNGNDLKMGFNCIIQYFCFLRIIFVSTMPLKGYFRRDFNYFTTRLINFVKEIVENMQKLCNFVAQSVNGEFSEICDILGTVIVIQSVKNIQKLSIPRRLLITSQLKLVLEGIKCLMFANRMAKEIPKTPGRRWRVSK